MEFRSTLAVSLVVVTVLLAGCSGLVGDEGPGSPEEFEYADGYSADGITDGEAASESYSQGLQEQGSYTVEYNQRIQEVQADVVYRVDVENQKAYHSVDVPSEDYGVESYYTEDRQFTRVFRPEEGNVSVEEREFTAEALDGADVIDPLLSNTTVYESRIEERDGTSVVVYEANGTEAATEVFDIDGENVTAFSASLAVDSDGLVREARYEMSYLDGDGTEQTVSLDFEVTGLGETTVERPEWAAES